MIRRLSAGSCPWVARSTTRGLFRRHDRVMGRGYRALSPPHRPDEILAQEAAGWLGLVTRHQALEVLSRAAIARRTGSGQLRIVLPGIYAVPGAPETWEQKTLAGCLWATGLASHTTAASLLDLRGIGRAAKIDILTTRDMKSPREWLQLHRTESVPALHKIHIGRIPATSATRTLIDIAALLSEEALAVALDDSLARGLTSIDHIHGQLDRLGRRGRSGATRLSRLSLLKGVAPAGFPSTPSSAG